MQRYFYLNLLIAVLLQQTYPGIVLPGRVLPGMTASVAVAKEQPAVEKGQKAQNHGSPEILTEKLIRVRELETLLKSAVVEDNGRMSGIARQSLMRIFAHSYDVFQVETDSGITESIRAKALRILQKSSPAVQRDWAQSMSVDAEAGLRNAINSGDRPSLDAVARRFPMTEPGILAAVLSMTKEFLQGADKDIRRRLALLESEYRGTVLEPFLRKQSRSLALRLQTAAVEHSPDAVAGSPPVTKLSIATAGETGTLAPPWPKAKWEWRESVWKYPGAPQPEAGMVLESFVPGTASSLNEFNNWRPVFWGGTVVLRSPFRLVAFDRLSGEEQWSLPTNTYTPDIPDSETDQHAHDDPDELSMGFPVRSLESDSIGSLAAFGLLSFDDEYLFFVDRFDFFRRESGYGGFRQRILNGNRIGLRVLDEENTGTPAIATRLVALRRSSAGGAPTVAWIAGEETGFDYQVVMPESTVDAQSGASVEKHTVEDLPVHPPDAGRDPDSVRPEKYQLNGHRFLCPPAGSGRRLFVLSVHNDQFWLTCLSRESGHVDWQQPLIFSDDQVNPIWNSWDQDSDTSVCLVSGETVVCSLAEGILVGVRATDGQLSWATAIRGEPRTRPRAGFRINLPDEFETVDTTTVLVPCASESVVVCTSNPSTEIFGIDTQNGEILWTTPRCAFGPGDVGGSPDYYVAGISDSQVILIGERHCRSLDLRTGEQNWVTGISQTTGRAECRGGRCLIPQSDGSILTIRLEDGIALPRQQSWLPADARSQFGAVTSDKDILCVSTPVSLVVFPRADTMLNEPEAQQELTEESAGQIMNLVRAHLINGNSREAFSVLKKTLLRASSASQPQLRQPFERFLADLILQDWGEQFVRSLEQPDAQSFSAITTSEEAVLLSELNLSSGQQLRSAVLAVLSRPGTGMSKETVQELADFQEWRSPIFITDEWRVRPDLLLNRSASDPESAQAVEGRLNPVPLRRLAEDGILFQELFSSDSQRQMFANRLITSGDFAAADAFLGAWTETSGSTSNPESQPRISLTALRDRNVIAGYLPGEVREHFRPADAPDTGNPATGLSSSTNEPLDFDFYPSLRIPSWEQLQLVDRGSPMYAIPDWNRLKYFLTDGSEGFPELVSMDMSDGSIRDRIVLPFRGRRVDARIPRTGSTSLSAPGLLPIAFPDQMAMISCAVPSEAGVLWSRRYGNAAAGNSAVEFGPLGADHFVWQFGDELHCSHPLSGRDLWTRKLRLSHTRDSAADMRRIFGDRMATIVMGSDESSFERFSTRDGRFLGAGRLNMGRMTDPETIGRFLLYPDLTGRLHLFDGATGLDELEDDQPILLGPYNTRSAFRTLPGGRVLTVSSGFDIILIDTTQGKIIFRTPAKELIRQHDGLRYLFGLTAFEKNNLLYVGLDDEKDRNGMIVDRLLSHGDARITSGPLMCFNPTSGEIVWSTRLEDAIIPPVCGDPTDLLVAVCHKWADDDLRSVNAEILEIQLIAGKTGEVVAKSTSFSSQRPVRCSHIAATNTIEIVSRDSVISIHPERKSTVAP